MNFKKKFKIMVLLAILVAAALYFFPRHQHLLSLYVNHIFSPIQSLRSVLFGFIPVSVGDILYVLAALALLLVVGRWFYFLFRFRLHKERLAASILNTINTFVFCYLLFIIGWGANYYKPSLASSWNIHSDTTSKKDNSGLIAFNKFLITKLNAFAPHYRSQSFSNVDEQAIAYYRIFTDCQIKAHGLHAKTSLFGSFVARMAVEGYYNPFTGEAQVDGGVPGFMLPFVICHELAHQAGIAAEDDANLMAYALGTMVNDTSFNYSAYLNIWLYARTKLFRKDSVLANKLQLQLNKLTIAHIDTLEEIDRKYHGEISDYSSEMYDSYLRLEQQSGGIKSYANVITTAWELEQQRKSGKLGMLHIP